MQRDFTLMMRAARLSRSLPWLADLRLDESVRQFGGPLREQLDLSVEAESLKRFGHNFRCGGQQVVLHWCIRVLRRSLPLMLDRRKCTALQALDVGSYRGCLIRKPADALGGQVLCQLACRRYCAAECADAAGCAGCGAT